MMIKEKLSKLIDVKSIVTIILVLVLSFLVIYSAVTEKDLTGDLFLLFSNVVTMIVTFFFTKNKKDDNTSQQSEESK